MLDTDLGIRKWSFTSLPPWMRERQKVGTRFSHSPQRECCIFPNGWTSKSRCRTQQPQWRRLLQKLLRRQPRGTCRSPWTSPWRHRWRFRRVSLLQPAQTNHDQNKEELKFTTIYSRIVLLVLASRSVAREFNWSAWNNPVQQTEEGKIKRWIFMKPSATKRYCCYKVAHKAKHMPPSRHDGSGKEPTRFAVARLNSFPIWGNRGQKRARGPERERGSRERARRVRAAAEQSGGPERPEIKATPLTPRFPERGTNPRIPQRPTTELNPGQRPESIEEEWQGELPQNWSSGGLGQRTDGEDAGEQRAERPPGGPRGDGGVPGARPPQRVKAAAGAAGSGGCGPGRRGGGRHQMIHRFDDGRARSIPGASRA